MEEIIFYDWLVKEKAFTHFAAKDVISRCNRIKRIVGTEELTKEALTLLSLSNEFNCCSKYVKSQLRRSLTLFSEFKEIK